MRISDLTGASQDCSQKWSILSIPAITSEQPSYSKLLQVSVVVFFQLRMLRLTRRILLQFFGYCPPSAEAGPRVSCRSTPRITMQRGDLGPFAFNCWASAEVTSRTAGPELRGPPVDRYRDVTILSMAWSVGTMEISLDPQGNQVPRSWPKNRWISVSSLLSSYWLLRCAGSCANPRGLGG